MYIVMSIQTSQYIIPGLSVCWLSARGTSIQYLQRALYMEVYFWSWKSNPLFVTPYDVICHNVNLV